MWNDELHRLTTDGNRQTMNPGGVALDISKIILEDAKVACSSRRYSQKPSSTIANPKLRRVVWGWELIGVTARIKTLKVLTLQ